MRTTRWIAATLVASVSLLAAACTTGGGGYHPPANTPPVAHIVATPSTSGTAPLAVSFDGSTSTDAEGAVIDWAWDFGELGATANGVTASHTYNSAGTFTVTLTVTDNGALTDTDTVLITVTAPDDPNGRYVATTGNDTGTCSASSSPCLTINYATAQAASGDNVHVAAGSYPEVVEVTKNLNYKGPNAGTAGTGARAAEAVVKGFSNPRAGTITGISNTTYSGAISNATNTSAITGVTGAGAISYASGAGTITDATNASPIVITTSVAHQLTTGNSITVSGVVGNTAANTTKTITVIDDTHFSLDTTTGNGNYASGGAYKGGPVNITTTVPHGLTIGATYTTVNIAGLGGNTAANGSRTIVVTDATHFSVTGVNANATYTSGGTYSGILAVIATAAPHGLANGARVTITGVVGTTAVNVANKVVTVIDATHFTNTALANAAYTSGGSVANLAIVFTTSAPHNFPASNGLVTVTGVTGNTAANAASKVVTVLDATHFSIPVVPNGDYTGGGTYTSTPMVITTAAPHGLTASSTMSIVGVNGTTAANATWAATTVVDATHILLNSGVANAAYVSGGRYGSPLGTTISGATNASPIVITSAGAHGLSTGQSITIAGVLGNTAANGSWTVTVVDANHYSLDGSTGNATYTSGGTASGAQLSIDIDGFRIDVQGDTAYVAATASPLVQLFGGPAVTVHNNVFYGGTYDPACSYTCTTMTDYAFQIASGTVSFADNLVQNFRRPVNINQTSAIATNATVSGNTITGVTSRGFSLGGSTLTAVVVSGNTVDATGRTGASTPAGMTISNGGNTVSGNTFTGLSSGIYLDLCKKFITDNNTISGNTFTGNGIGFYMASTSGGQCASSVTEGTGGWVTGGGRFNGLSITGNNFLGNAPGVYTDLSGLGSVIPVTTGPINLTCNYWNSATGPTIAGNPGGTGDGITIVANPSQPTYSFSPWGIAAQPGGACTGS